MKAAGTKPSVRPERTAREILITPVAVDFGTYRHSTPEESNEIRAGAEKAFSKLLRPLYPKNAKLRILDAGCGLGFLVYIAAKCFSKAQVTGCRPVQAQQPGQDVDQEGRTEYECFGHGRENVVPEA